MNNNRKALCALFLCALFCLHFISCKKDDPGIFEGKYVGTLTYTAVDSIGNNIKADTFVAVKISNRDVKFSDTWFALTGSASGNNAIVSQSSASNNVTGQVSLNGTTLTITGVDIAGGGDKINYSFIGTKQ